MARRPRLAGLLTLVLALALGVAPGADGQHPRHHHAPGATPAPGEDGPRSRRVTTEGFHYGADVTLPRDLRRITLTINPPTVKVLGPRRFASPVRAVIDWTSPGR